MPESAPLLRGNPCLLAEINELRSGYDLKDQFIGMRHEKMLL